MAVPLLIAEVGGGMIISPNLTLALQNVSVAMAGAAGGPVQPHGESVRRSARPCP
ncbi:MAG TPA: hypothetical protein VNT24_12585 [Propionibacteriaceae bacterium]|nr:hypothetical protein [Propionibacteriaceae bacterium]